MSVITSSAFFAFSIALPFGLVSLMCVQRTLLNGALRGLACAGAATAHGLFAILAVLGADAITESLTGWQPLVRPASGALMVIIGLKILVRIQNPQRSVITKTSGFAGYLAGLMLALTNPATILPYLALVGSGMFVERRLLTLSATVAGVLLGSITCYAALSGSTWTLEDRLPHTLLSRFNFLAGAALVAMGFRLVAQRPRVGDLSAARNASSLSTLHCA